MPGVDEIGCLRQVVGWRLERVLRPESGVPMSRCNWLFTEIRCCCSRSHEKAPEGPNHPSAYGSSPRHCTCCLRLAGRGMLSAGAAVLRAEPPTHGASLDLPGRMSTQL